MLSLLHERFVYSATLFPQCVCGCHAGASDSPASATVGGQAQGAMGTGPPAVVRHRTP